MRASLLFVVVAACGPVAGPTAPVAHGVVIDRFSAAAAHLMVRDATNGLPAVGAPIDLDVPPFVAHGLGPDGAHVHYYNFDVQPDRPARMYRIVDANGAPVAGQPAIVDVIPGDLGYSDFWRVADVRAPDGFVAGSIDRASQLRGLPIEEGARTAIDCPIVPRGTTAREGNPERVELAYRGARIECLRFGEPLALDGDDVPTSPIYVTFAHEHVFRTEPGAAAQTHNVVLSVPGDADYSPLWAVHVYDPSAFDRVHDEASAIAAPVVNAAGPHVNCPVVSVAP